MNHWLLKSEPSTFGVDDLERRPGQTEAWDGVRNYQARNYLRDGMKKGDLAFLYHSNCKEPGIVAIMEVVREGYPDPSAFDPKSGTFDPKSTPERPRWFMVDVKLVRRLARPVALAELKKVQQLEEMVLLRRGNRLSVLPVTETEWKTVLDLE